MSDGRPKHDHMSIDESMVPSIWEIAAIMELLE